MNKQRVELLKEASYALQRVQSEKQAGIKAKNLSKALESLKRLIKYFTTRKQTKPVPAPKANPVPPKPALAPEPKIPFDRLSKQDQDFGIWGYGLTGDIAAHGVQNDRYINPRSFHNSLKELQSGLNEGYKQLPETSYYRSPNAPNFPKYLERFPDDAMNMRLNSLGDRYENMARQRFLGQTGNTEAERRAFDKAQNVIGREAEEYLDFMGRRGPKGEVLYNIENPDKRGTDFFNMYDQLFKPE